MKEEKMRTVWGKVLRSRTWHDAWKVLADLDKVDMADVIWEFKKRIASPKLICTCGKEVPLEVLGGQYQDDWEGTCPDCQTEWKVTNLSAYLKEFEEEEEE